MPMFRSFAWLAVAGALFFGTTAYAATCSLNIAQMYNAAVAKGWKFKCMKGVLHFDNQKRPGCTAKPIIPQAWEEARFLSDTGNLDHALNGKLRNGWRVKDYEVSGGQWNRKSSGKGAKSSRIHFTFTTKAGQHTRRYLSRVRIEKSGGSCANVYQEAF